MDVPAIHSNVSVEICFTAIPSAISLEILQITLKLLSSLTLPKVTHKQEVALPRKAFYGCLAQLVIAYELWHNHGKRSGRRDWCGEHNSSRRPSNRAHWLVYS